MHRRGARVIGLVALMAVLSGCRVFVFPESFVGGNYFESEAVTITNTTADSYFVRIDFDCGAVVDAGAGVWVGNDEGTIGVIGLPGTTQTHVCSDTPALAYPQVLTVFEFHGAPMRLFVLEPGASITLRARVLNTDAAKFQNKAVRFEAYGDWCITRCYDMVKFT